MVARQAPLSTEFSRQEFWSGLPLPSPGNLSNLGVRPWSPTRQADSLLSELPGKPGGRGENSKEVIRCRPYHWALTICQARASTAEILNLSESKKGKHRDPLGFAKLFAPRDRPTHLLSQKTLEPKFFCPSAQPWVSCCRFDSLCVPWLLDLALSCH